MLVQRGLSLCQAISSERTLTVAVAINVPNSLGGISRVPAGHWMRDVVRQIIVAKGVPSVDDADVDVPFGRQRPEVGDVDLCMKKSIECQSHNRIERHRSVIIDSPCRSPMASFRVPAGGVAVRGLGPREGRFRTAEIIKVEVKSVCTPHLLHSIDRVNNLLHLLCRAAEVRDLLDDVFDILLDHCDSLSDSESDDTGKRGQRLK